MISIEAMREFGLIDSIPYMLMFIVGSCVIVDCFRALGFIRITKRDHELSKIYYYYPEGRITMIDITKPVHFVMIFLFMTLLMNLLFGSNKAFIGIIIVASAVIALMMVRVHQSTMRLLENKDEIIESNM